jgi:hypothetical protein
VAELSVFSPGYDGAGFVTQAADSGGDQFENTGDTVLYLQNAGAGSITVTLTPDFDPRGLLFAPVQVVVAAGQIRLVGALLRQWWSNSAGKVVMAYSGVSGLSVGVMQLGSRLKYDAAAFLPSALSGLILWLDASNLASLFQDDAGATPVATNNDPVGRWADLSGAGNHVMQATGTAKPTYQTGVQGGLPGVSFDGGDYLDGVATYASYPLTIVGVGKQSATLGATRGLVSLYHSTTFGTRMWLGSTDQPSLAVATPSTQRTAPISIGANAPFVFGGSVTPINAVALSNNSFTTIAAHAAGLVSNNIAIGRFNINTATNLMNGHICEVLIYNRGLTIFELERVGSYLNTKWGVY